MIIVANPSTGNSISLPLSKIYDWVVTREVPKNWSLKQDSFVLLLGVYWNVFKGE